MKTIELSPEAKERIQYFKNQTRKRGLKRSDWVKVISAMILKQKDETWWKLINQFSSDEFLIEEAMKHENLKKKILSVIQSQPLSFKRPTGIEAKSPATIVLRKAEGQND